MSEAATELAARPIRFRLYPSDEQVATIESWQRSLRFLWNCAHEQRLSALGGRGPRIDVYLQKREWTECRRENQWQAALPCCVGQQVLIELDKAWQRWRTKLAKRPRFKSRRDYISLVAQRGGWAISGEARRGVVRFIGLGDVRATLHRDLPGEATSCRIVREVDEYYAVIMCKVNPARPRGSEKVGIDRGVTSVVADSTGVVVDNPSFIERQSLRLARAQRALSKKKKGSANRKKAAGRVARILRDVARQRLHFHHELSAYYVRRAEMIAIEDLRIGNMTASAAGTVDDPGKNVRQKAGLNRRILDAGWGTFERLLEYKLADAGGRLVRVPPRYTSQTCSVCGVVDSQSRDGKQFTCLHCGHAEDADTNAAKNILSAGLAAPVAGPKQSKKLRAVKRRKGAGEPSVQACGGKGASSHPDESGSRSREAPDPAYIGDTTMAETNASE